MTLTVLWILHMALVMFIAIKIILIVQTVLQELRHLNLGIYKRIFSLINKTDKIVIFFPNEVCIQTVSPRIVNESPNDYNDRLIRMAARYYANILLQTQNEESSGWCTNVLLLSNDRIQRVSWRYFCIHFAFNSMDVVLLNVDGKFVDKMRGYEIN